MSQAPPRIELELPPPSSPSLTPRTPVLTPVQQELNRVRDLREHIARGVAERERAAPAEELLRRRIATRLTKPGEFMPLDHPDIQRMTEQIGRMTPEEIRSELSLRRASAMVSESDKSFGELMTGLRMGHQASRGFLDTATFGASEFAFRALEELGDAPEDAKLTEVADLLAQGRYGEVGARIVGEFAGFTKGPLKLIKRIQAARVAPGLPGATLGVGFGAAELARAPSDLARQAFLQEAGEGGLEQVGKGVGTSMLLGPLFAIAGGTAKGAVKAGAFPVRKAAEAVGTALRRNADLLDTFLLNLERAGIRAVMRAKEGSTPVNPITQKQIRYLATLAKEKGLTFPDDIRAMTSGGSVSKMTAGEAANLIDRLRGRGPGTQLRGGARPPSGPPGGEGQTSFLPPPPVGPPNGMVQTQNPFIDWLLNNRAIGQARMVVRRMAPSNGEAVMEMVEQQSYRAALGAGKYVDRDLHIFDTLGAKDRRRIILMHGGRIPEPDPNDQSKVAQAYRALRENNAAQMPHVRGAGIQTTDGRAFQEQRFWMPQTWDHSFREALQWAMTPLKVGRRKVIAQQWLKNQPGQVPENLEGSVRSGGFRTRKIKALWERWHDILATTTEQMRQRRLMYRQGQFQAWPENKQIRESTLKQMAVRALRDHRTSVGRDPLARIPAEQLPPERGERFVPELQLHRVFEWPERFLAKDLVKSWVDSTYRRWEKIAEQEVFGQKLERLETAVRAALSETGEQAHRMGTDPHARTQFLGNLINNMLARQAQVRIGENAVETAARPESSALDIARTLFGGMTLSIGSRFATGGNLVWGLFGLGMQAGAIRTLRGSGLTLPAITAGIGAGVGVLDDDVSVGQGAAVGAGLGLVARAAVGGPARALAVGSVPGAMFSRRARQALRRVPQIAAATRAGAMSPVGQRTVPSASGITEMTGTRDLENWLRRYPVMMHVKNLFLGTVEAHEAYLRAISAETMTGVAEKALGALERNPKLIRFNGPRGAQARMLNRLLGRPGIQRIREIAGRGTGFTEAELTRIAQEGVGLTQFFTRPMDLPISWSHTSGKLITQFWSMAYRQTLNTVGTTLEEAGHGNLVPAIRFLVLGTAAGLGIEELGDVLYGHDLNPRAQIKWDKWIRIIGNAMGVVDRPLQATELGTDSSQAFLKAFTPFAAQQVYRLGGSIVEAAKLVGESLVGTDPEGLPKAGKRLLSGARQLSAGVRTASAVRQRFAPTEEELRSQLQSRLNRATKDLGASVASASPIEAALRAAGSARQLASPTVTQAKERLAGTEKEALLRGDHVLRRLAEQEKAHQGRMTTRERVEVMLGRRRPQQAVTPKTVLNRMSSQARSSARQPYYDDLWSHLKRGNTGGADEDMEALFRLGTTPDMIESSVKQRQIKDLGEGAADGLRALDLPRMWRRYYEVSDLDVDGLIAELASASTADDNGVRRGPPKKGEADRVSAIQDRLRSLGVARGAILRKLIRLRHEDRMQRVNP